MTDSGGQKIFLSFCPSSHSPYIQILLTLSFQSKVLAPSKQPSGSGECGPENRYQEPSPTPHPLPSTHRRPPGYGLLRSERYEPVHRSLGRAPQWRQTRGFASPFLCKEPLPLLPASV